MENYYKRYFDEIDVFENPAFGKIIFMEIILSFLFTTVFLMFNYSQYFKKSDFILKGFGLMFTLWFCH